MSEIPGISIRTAVPADLGQLARLRALLWPESSVEDHAGELAQEFAAGASGGFPVTYFVAETSGRALVGFLQVRLRSHADGCDTSKPVGYIEGWYVAEGFRLQGFGGKLIAAAEDWARRLGCREMASDALIDNAPSQQAHEALGYSEVDRCVHFRKAL